LRELKRQQIDANGFFSTIHSASLLADAAASVVGATDYRAQVRAAVDDYP